MMTTDGCCVEQGWVVNLWVLVLSFLLLTCPGVLCIVPCACHAGECAQGMLASMRGKRNFWTLQHDDDDDCFYYSKKWFGSLD